MENTQELKTYHGNCLCGNFNFSIRTPELKDIRTCDCSICTKVAYLWIYPIVNDNMRVITGEGGLKEYQFAGKMMTHFFCPKCGSYMYGNRKNAEPGRSIGINARVLKNVDLDSLKLGAFPGSELGTKYETPWHPDWKGDIEDGFRIYKGSCHCRRVTHAVMTKPLEESKVLSQNSSVCSKNGDLWIYPTKDNVQIHGDEHLTNYGFVTDTSLHSFCSTCGVSVVVKAIRRSDTVWPLNVRTFDGINLENLKCNHDDEITKDPQ